ncbi:MAG TPA: tetratricopeptide repeat protein [Chitinophagaceae bacterium]|nr:MAG: family 2 glycosyl transferase [Bacteroidetes bacterium OLB11]HMN32494.1 tetratricopeptide repeat protein [Chitinophagaceae bacterium]
MAKPNSKVEKDIPKNEESSNTTAEQITPNQSLLSKIYLFSLVAVFILMTVMSFSYGISGDEVDMNEYGKVILKYFTSFGADHSVFRTSEELRSLQVYDYNRDNVVQYYGGLFDFVCAIVNKISPFEEYTTRHILTAWMGFLAIFFVAKIIKLISSNQASIIAIWLMFLSPFFLGHAMNNPKDIPFAATYIMAIYFIISMFERAPNLKKLDYLWVILSIGATINIRVGGILLIPYLFVFAGIYFITKKYLQKENVALTLFVKPIFITAILSYFAGSLLWPYALQNPISNPLTALSEMGNFKVNLKQIYEGQKIFSGELPATYLLNSFMITNTFVVLAGIALGFVFFLSFRKNSKAHILYFVLFTAVFPLLYIIYTKANVYHAWRHVLFIFPSAIVVAAFGWNQMILFFEKMKVKLVGIGMFFFLLLEPTYFIVSSYPNTITYYNQIVGGVKGAYANYEMDYYYNSLKQCADWFKKTEAPKYKNTDTIWIMSNAAHILSNYFTDHKNILVDYIRYPERNQKKWDYLIMHIALIPLEDIKYELWLPSSSTLYKSEVQGKVLSAVIKRPSDDDLKGFELLQSNAIDSAVIHFENYLKKDSNNTSILNLLSNIFMQTDQVQKATQFINQSYSLDSSNMETKQLMGVISLQNNDFAKAQFLFQQILNENPQYAKGYYYLGVAQMGTNQLDAALNNFNKASQDESIRQGSYKYMGDIFMKKGNPQDAARFYKLAGLDIPQ